MSLKYLLSDIVIPARKTVAILDTMVPIPSRVATHWYWPANADVMLSITRDPFDSCFLYHTITRMNNTF